MLSLHLIEWPETKGLFALRFTFTFVFLRNFIPPGTGFVFNFLLGFDIAV